MTYSLGKKSLEELEGVHPDLTRVVKHAITITTQDFSVHDGLRSEAEQRENIKRKVSWTMDSQHCEQSDKCGHAVDLVPWINGQLRWEWGPIYNIAAAMSEAARDEDVLLRWGGVWDTPFEALGKTAADFEKAVHAYVARRLKAGKRAAIDGPHFELAR